MVFITIMTVIDNENVGARIKKIRINHFKKKLTQQEFANLLLPPVDKSAVRKWEKGLNLPNEDRLKQIADIGEVSIDFLLFGKQLNGYGKRIEDLRESERLTQEELGRILLPAKSEEEIAAIENEVYFPKYEELKQFAEKLNSTIYFISFGISRRQSVHPLTDFDVYEKLDTTERLLQASNLTKEELVDSDMFFDQMNDIRLKQIDNPDYFNAVSKLITLINPENIDEVLKNLEK